MPRQIPLARRLVFLSIPSLVLILLLAGIEGAVRLFLPHISFLDALIQPEALRVDVGQSKDSPLFMGDPLLFWRLRPNLKEVVWDFTVVSTNAQGVRHDGDIGRKPAKGWRLLCLGDSVTFGYRVPLVFGQVAGDYARDQLPYPLLVEKRLREANPGRQIDVVPLAVPAYTSYQGLNWLRRDLPRYQPDVVTICFGWNDVGLRSVADRDSMPVDWLHVNARALMAHSQALIHFSWWPRRQTKRTVTSAGRLLPRVSQDDYVANLLEAARLARAQDAQPVFIAPLYRDAIANPAEAASIKQYRDALRAAAEKNRVAYVEVPELTEAGYPGNNQLFGELIHPNYAGHDLLAGELLKFLAAQGMLGTLNAPQNPMSAMEGRALFRP